MIHAFLVSTPTPASELQVNGQLRARLTPQFNQSAVLESPQARIHGRWLRIAIPSNQEDYLNQGDLCRSFGFWNVDRVAPSADNFFVSRALVRVTRETPGTDFEILESDSFINPTYSHYFTRIYCSR